MGSWRTRRSCGSASWHVRARMRRTLVMPALRVLASGSVCRSTLCPLYNGLRPLSAPTGSVLPWMRGHSASLVLDERIQSIPCLRRTHWSRLGHEARRG